MQKSDKKYNMSKKFCVQRRLMNHSHEACNVEIEKSTQNQDRIILEEPIKDKSGVYRKQDFEKTCDLWAEERQGPMMNPSARVLRDVMSKHSTLDVVVATHVRH